MPIDFDAEDWISSIRSRAAVALADRPSIDPPQSQAERPLDLTLKERVWNPNEGAEILEDLSQRSCVMLRNFLPRGEAERLAEIGWRTFDEVDSNLARTAEGLPPIHSAYCRLRDAETDHRLGNERSMRAFGGMMIESVPYAGHHLFELLRASGLLPIVKDFIGGQPLIASAKCSLRLGDKDAPVRHVFHQDGAFLGGPAARTVNIWLALTDAGIDAPGLEVLPYRLSQILPVGREGSFVSWEIASDTVYAQFGRKNFVIPEFRAGDALLFDQMCLHRTHVRPEMTKKRLAYECWFFPPDPKYARLDLLGI